MRASLNLLATNLLFQDLTPAPAGGALPLKRLAVSALFLRQQPEIALDAPGIAHADLNVVLLMESRIWIER